MFLGASVTCTPFDGMCLPDVAVGIEEGLLCVIGTEATPHQTRFLQATECISELESFAGYKAT